MKYVFISHKNEEPDRSITNRLYRYLSEHKLAAWYDAQLCAGDWPEQLSVKLRGATAYILVASERSLASSSFEVTDEVGKMREECKRNGKKIVVFALDDYVFHLPPGTAEYFLGSNRYQAVQLYNYSSEQEAFEKVRTYLAAELEEFENNPDDFVYEGNILKSYKGKDRIVVIPSYTEEIAEDAFNGNWALSKVIIPPSVCRIGRRAFFGCGELSAVEGMEGVHCCENTAFDRTSVERAHNGVWVLNGVALCGSCTDGILEFPTGTRTIANRAFVCSEAKRIVFHDGLAHIGTHAFRDCYDLEEIEFPNSVQSIGKGAFFGCLSLKRAIFHGKMPPRASEAFDNIQLEEME